MRKVIIHGKRVLRTGFRSPRAGREDCELWGIARANELFWRGRLTDWTRWFSLHPLVEAHGVPGIAERCPEEWAWMRAQDGTRPIYLQAPEAHPPADQLDALVRFNEIPGAVRFPLKQVMHRFPINGEPNRWFVDQTALVMAFALCEGFGHIVLNGVGQSARLDFVLSHISILYWTAFARGLGVTVTIEGPSFLHAPDGVYSYDFFNHDLARRAEGVPV